MNCNSAVIRVLVVGLVAVIGLVVVGFAIGVAMRPGGEKSSYYGGDEVLGNREIAWNFDIRKGVWFVNGDPPACADPLIVDLPVEVSEVASVLYPGQTRGGDYKPHGGFRFRQADNLVDVRAPMDAYMFRVSKHFALGEIQYSLWFMNDCGAMYKFDHLRTLVPEFEKIFDDFPPPPVEDTRTTEISPRVFVEQGKLISREIGFRNNNNVSMDFGLYDLRAKNEVANNPAWVASHPGQEELGEYALCWLNNIDLVEAEILDNLPVGGVEGKTSDYCD